MQLLSRVATAATSAWDLIRLALASVADTAIVPLQDVLGLGSEARMNTPGRAGGNWSWRYTPAMLAPQVIDRLRTLTELYGRAPDNEAAEGAGKSGATQRGIQL